MKKTGTREWAVKTVNCIKGCGHRCRYCYARANALRYKYPGLRSAEEWGTSYHRVRVNEVRRKRPNYPGVVMFPSTHDVEPKFLGECLAVLKRLLGAGNEVLLVSKPHYECIATLCRELSVYRQRLRFRFTFTARNPDVLRYWEPGAPNYMERVACLALARHKDFSTSVSVEPMLDTADVVGMFHDIEPMVSETIWIGKMNQVRQRAIAGTSEAALRAIEEGQTDERIREIVAALDGEKKVRWKDSISRMRGVFSSQ